MRLVSLFLGPTNNSCIESQWTYQLVDIATAGGEDHFLDVSHTA
jgi:hypothetical protein